MTPPLADLPKSLADDPVVAAATGGSARPVAVPEPARAIFAATLAQTTARRPIVLVVPTGVEAERIAADLREYLGDDAVEIFPAWETLPFERVSPAIETMGRRLRVMWRLQQGGDELPAAIVAPVRALVQRLGPHVEEVDPIEIAPGMQIDRDELVARLVNLGYRREYQVEARGEVATRGSIVDVYPSTADHPVRIDLWGDEVDRLSEFSVADQRSTVDIPNTRIFPVRELLPTDDVKKRAAELLAEQPWGREQWERLSEGATFDGMESWLPWLTADEHLLPDLLPPSALVALFEPRRLRDRAQELLDEEAALASTLATTWGAPIDEEHTPRLSLPFDRLLEHTKAQPVPVLAGPDNPDTPVLAASGFDPVVGDVEGLAKRFNGLKRDGYRVLVAAEGTGSKARIEDMLVAEGAPVDVIVAALDRGVVLPTIKLALIAEADLTGRRRVHRKPRSAQKATDHYEGLRKGDFVVHRVHGIGRYDGMESREMFGITRDRLVVEFKGGDKVYVDSEDIGLIRKYTGGEEPKLSKMGGADWEKTRGRVRKAVRDIAGQLVVLYRRRLATQGHAFGPDTPFQKQIEDAFPYEETPDQLSAIIDT
jgi:transcription-repair coupling factor (superfamily II helicase)